MWFKNITIYQLEKPIDYKPAQLEESLQAFIHTPCSPSLSMNLGWASPIDQENAPLVHAIPGHMMICLNLEEKLLPATVVRHELNRRIKKMESAQKRRIPNKDRRNLKDDIYNSLLPQAFSKNTRIYAYIDTKNNWLIIDSVALSKVNEFTSFLKRSAPEIKPITIKTKKLSSLMANWLQHDDCPDALTIEDACVLQDPNKQGRIIRCKQQDLYANSIQSLLKDGLEVSQMTFNWQNQITFTLKEDFTLSSIKYHDVVLEQVAQNHAETEQERFDADFFIMTETIGCLIIYLMKILCKK